MRHVVYLGGITASGKTTAAKKLSDLLGLPVYQADMAYSAIAQWLHYPKADDLVMPEKWGQIPRFGGWKHEAYKSLIGQERGDFIIEGFPLYFEQDRQLISQVIGGHWATFFRLKPPVEVWLGWAAKKFGKPHSSKDYDKLQSYFEPPAQHYEIADFGVLLAHCEPYQRVGLTDEKWRRLNLKGLRGKTVLDLGCNSGWIGEYCLKAGASRVVGVDCNWRYLEEARERGLETKLLNLNDLSSITERFDLVLCLATFHYLVDKASFIKECARLGRRLVLEVPVAQEPGLKLVKKNDYFIPTADLVLDWLRQHFKKVLMAGESVAPDDSYRLIFKAS